MTKMRYAPYLLLLLAPCTAPTQSDAEAPASSKATAAKAHVVLITDDFTDDFGDVCRLYRFYDAHRGHHGQGYIVKCSGSVSIAMH